MAATRRAVVTFYVTRVDGGTDENIISNIHWALDGVIPYKWALTDNMYRVELLDSAVSGIEIQHAIRMANLCTITPLCLHRHVGFSISHGGRREDWSAVCHKEVRARIHYTITGVDVTPADIATFENEMVQLLLSSSTPWIQEASESFEMKRMSTIYDGMTAGLVMERLRGCKFRPKKTDDKKKKPSCTFTFVLSDFHPTMKMSKTSLTVTAE